MSIPAPATLPIRTIQHTARVRAAATGHSRSNLYLSKNVYLRDEVFLSKLAPVTVPQDSAVVFCDIDPHKNWGHDCYYLFFDPKSGELTKTIPATLPPWFGEPDGFDLFHAGTPIVASQNPTIPLWMLPSNLQSVSASKWFAILFSGQSNGCHVNDMEFLYRTLVDHHGVPEGNILVLNFHGHTCYTGQDGLTHDQPRWPGTSPADYRISPVAQPGTKQNFEYAFQQLPKLGFGEDSSLLLYTTNHGNTNRKETVLLALNQDQIETKELSGYLNSLPKYQSLLVVMQQCFAGAFIEPVMSNTQAKSTSIATAASARSSSVSSLTPDTDFDPFSLAWISGLAGSLPDGTLQKEAPGASGKAFTAKDLFDFAHKNDRQGKCLGDLLQFQETDSSQTAVMLQSDRVATALPEQFRLLPADTPIPELSGLTGIALHQHLREALGMAHGTFLDRLKVSGELMQPIATQDPGVTPG